MQPEKREATENGQALESLFSQRFLQLAEMQANSAPKPLALQDAIAVYCRRSDETANLSIARQVKRASDYARDRLNGIVTYVYSDEGVSGETASRPGLDEMMRDARAGRFSVLIVEDLDRLGRKFGVIGNTYDELVDLGIKIHSVIKGDAVGNVDVALKGLAATEFQVNLRARSRDGKDLAFSKGRIISPLPFGYMRDTYIRGRFIIDESLKPLIEWMFKARIGGMIITDIIIGLKEMAENKDLIPNTPFAITRALMNPIYKGVYTFGRNDRTIKARGKARRQRPPAEWHRAYYRHMQIVSANDWEDVNKTFKTGRKQKATRLLSLKATCTYCGRPLAVQTGPDNKPFYRCHRWHISWGVKAGKCISRATTAIPLERLGLAAIRQVLGDPNLEEVYKTMVDAEIKDQRTALARRRRELEHKKDAEKEELKCYMRAFAKSGVFGDDVVEEEIAEIRAKLNETKAKLAALPDFDRDFAIEGSQRASLLEVFDRASPKAFVPEHELTTLEKEERGVLRGLIAGIRVTPMLASRTTTVVVDISTSGLLGYSLPSDSSVPAVTSFTYRLHEETWGWRPDVAEVFQSRQFALTDGEWDAVFGEFRSELAALDFEPSQIRELLDLTAFVSATSTRRFHVLKLGLPRKGPLPAAVGRLFYVGLWDRIRLFLESNFPSRRDVFNPDITSVYQTKYDLNQRKKL